MAFSTTILSHGAARLVQHRDQALLVLAVVITLAVLDGLTTQAFEREQAYRRTLVAQQLQARLQSEMEEHVTALIALNVVYQNFVDINHYDFQQYGQSITANLKGFRHLYFIDPQNNIRRVYPLSPENSKLYGVSLTPCQPCQWLLQQAKTTRRPLASGLITFQEHPQSVLAVIPIYRNNREFLGYAAGEIDMNRVWRSLLHSESLSRQYQLQLMDNAGTPLFPNRRINLKNPAITQTRFDMANQHWTLLVKPIHSTFRAILLQRLSLWGSGLVILALLLLIIAASKRHKITLDNAQRKFETIFLASPDGILMLDEQLRLQLVNPPIQTWSGLKKADLREKTFFDLFTCQCPHLTKCRELSYLLCTSEQFEQDLPETLEAQLTHAASGTTRTLRLNASRVQHTGQPEPEGGFICVLGDISMQKELERMKETHVATLTHDLKTPLLGQELVLDTMLSEKSGPITTEQQRLLTGARNSVNDLLEMVNLTLLYYQIESSHLVLHKQSLPLTVLLKEVMETLKPLLTKRGLTFELEAAVDLPHAWVDPIPMKRVFHNLLSNALVYARRGTPIRVTLQPDSAERLLIGIQNDGKGIPPTELPKIFEKYYSLSRKYKQIGTGLGLYISRRIVELHGGKIWAESEPDQQTQFFVSLPCPQQI